MPTLTLIQPPGERLQFAHTDNPTMTPERGLAEYRKSLHRMQAAYELQRTGERPEEANFGECFDEAAGVASCALDLSLVCDGADREFADSILGELKAWIAQQPDPQAWNNAFHVAMDRECEEEAAQ